MMFMEVTGSLSISGSFSNGFTITEISNDTSLTDGSGNALLQKIFL